MKVALVTGASRGIGRAIALSLASDGLAVAVHYDKSADAAEKLFQRLPKVAELHSPSKEISLHPMYLQI
jgi:NAD(P)-dependent dehydrogenase (short-subunit alcohol dehydrogenase family)